MDSKFLDVINDLVEERSQAVINIAYDTQFVGFDPSFLVAKLENAWALLDSAEKKKEYENSVLIVLTYFYQNGVAERAIRSMTEQVKIAVKRIGCNIMAKGNRLARDVLTPQRVLVCFPVVLAKCIRTGILRPKVATVDDLPEFYAFPGAAAIIPPDEDVIIEAYRVWTRNCSVVFNNNKLDEVIVQTSLQILTTQLRSTTYSAEFRRALFGQLQAMQKVVSNASAQPSEDQKIQ